MFAIYDFNTPLYLHFHTPYYKKNTGFENEVSYINRYSHLLFVTYYFSRFLIRTVLTVCLAHRISSLSLFVLFY